MEEQSYFIIVLIDDKNIKKNSIGAHFLERIY
jgi:hypothetical protein